MNPFMSRWPLEDHRDWIGSQEAFKKLESCVDQRVNACILGPAGSGKSSLLNCFFTYAYRKQMAKERKILIYTADLSTRADGEDICNYLAELLKNSVRRLLPRDGQTDGILQDLQEIGENSSMGKSRLQTMIHMLHDAYGYFVLLVMDNFELFTSSPEITMEHHETLRSLILAHILQCIVATDYDLSQDSLPEDVRGSYLLQSITESILLTPFEEKDVLTFMQSRQRTCSRKIEDPQLLQKIGLMSGGIPWFVEAAADCTFRNLEEYGGHLEEKKCSQAIFETCKPLMWKWCKLLTDSQLEVLRLLSDRMKKDKKLAGWNIEWDDQILQGRMEELKSAVQLLKARGLLRQVYEQDSFGNWRKGPENLVCFNSKIFQAFCARGLMEKAAQENPLRKPEKTKEQEEPASDRQGAPVIQLAPGAKLVLKEENHYGPIQINQVITPSEVLGVLNRPDQLCSLFSGRFAGLLGSGSHNPVSQLQSLEQRKDRLLTDAGNLRLEQEYDEAFHQLENQILSEPAVDEQQDLLDVTPEEQKTLEEQFELARRENGRAMVTDELLESLSERCQFYTRLAVVVESALSRAAAAGMAEFSPQLVLYGKAIEQALRDCFFELFHQEKQLSVFPLSGENFRGKRRDTTYIGNYTFLMEGCREHLGELCETCGSAVDVWKTDGSWSEWWNRLRMDIDEGRRIRNLLAHAAETAAPTQEDLNRMCRLLFGKTGQEGILHRVLIGKALSAQLFPSDISQDVIASLVGSVCPMRCIKRKSNGGLRGKICKGGYTVNISPRKAEKGPAGLLNPDFDPAGQIFQIRVLEFRNQDGQNFFAAEFAD